MRIVLYVAVDSIGFVGVHLNLVILSYPCVGFLDAKPFLIDCVVFSFLAVDWFLAVEGFRSTSQQE